MRASVVLPEPGGPHKMNEKSSFFSMATRRGFSTPVKCSCPTNSSSFFGRILEANGSTLLLYQIHLTNTPIHRNTGVGLRDLLERLFCTYEYKINRHRSHRHYRARSW